MLAYYKGKVVCTAIHNKSNFFAFMVNGKFDSVTLRTLADASTLTLNELSLKTLADFI